MPQIDAHDAQRWFSVRCILQILDLPGFEERITLWLARDFDEAISLAEADVREEVSALAPSISYTGLAQAFALFDEPEAGAEVFSLIRESRLSPTEYLSAFFDTGSEHQQRAR